MSSKETLKNIRNQLIYLSFNIQFLRICKLASEHQKRIEYELYPPESNLLLYLLLAFLSGLWSH